ncbi:MAG: DUF1566 domain-containing protein [bacterium]
MQIFLNLFKIKLLRLICLIIISISSVSASSYDLADTDQSLCFDTLELITPPQPGEPFYGQDAQFDGLLPSYTDNGDGTVTDNNTGLMWVKELAEDKMTWDDAMAGADTCTVGGYNDWRLPTIKELYSLILFSGTDPSGPDPDNLIPFLDTAYFEFRYGDTLSGERLIDAQYWSSTVYRGLTMNGDSTAFGVNFADGRIKGYPKDLVGPPGQQFQMTSFVRYVRGSSYGQNQFQDNGDGTVTDLATGLMWQKADDGVGRNWEQALVYAESLELGGYDDWRLPNAHELQSIVDYTRSLQATGSPAIDTVFICTEIIDEGGGTNYGFYWTGTTHKSSNNQNMGTFAVYISFGEALGWMMTPDSLNWMLWDVHGAGAQRSDPKCGDPSQYPHGHGPQGDVVRIYNLVRCVRDVSVGVNERSYHDPGGSQPLQVIENVVSPSSVVFRYNLKADSPVVFSIYDLSGREITTLINGQVKSGQGEITWNSEGICSGMYFGVMKTSYSIFTINFILI